MEGWIAFDVKKVFFFFFKFVCQRKLQHILQKVIFETLHMDLVINYHKKLSYL